ncbi:MAG: hypothetical protein NVSMB44_36100 [Ktedonobacteraceae bacterium]
MIISSPAPFPTASMNLRLTEEILYDLPPLEGVFLHWHTHGVAAATATPGITSLLHRREQLLGTATLPGASIKLLYECAMACLHRLPGPVYSPWNSRPLHARLLRHGPSQSAAETQVLLPPGVLVQKTVTVALGEHLLLCSGVGTQSLTRRQLQDIATALAFPHRTMKRCTINSSAHHSVEAFARQPGMVSPFLHPKRATELVALVLLPWRELGEAQEREVAISLSLWESLALPLRCLHPLLRRYARRAYPGVRLIELGNASTLEAFEEVYDGS